MCMRFSYVHDMYWDINVHGDKQIWHLTVPRMAKVRDLANNE